MKTDKKTSNLFIAGGYCLVAVIILFNYLGQAVSKERTIPSRSAVETTDQAPAQLASMDALTRQLDEEKRVNLEMREMLKMMQSALGDGNFSPQTEAIYNADQLDNSFEIPDIRFNLAENMVKVKTNPFIPGKNPFAPKAKIEDVGGNTVLDAAFMRALRCDPRLPFFISGANTRSGYFANF